MADPWDPFPMPDKGDSVDDLLYASVGQVINQWECIEFELASLYSVFVGRPNEHVAWKAYGAGRIFRERLAILREAARAYFIRHCDQALEGAFDNVSDRAERFSVRRHEAAHGMIIDMSGITFFKQRLLDPTRAPQFGWVPALYAFRNHDEKGLPEYAYTSKEFIELARRLNDLWLDVKAYKEYFRQHWKP